MANWDEELTQHDIELRQKIKKLEASLKRENKEKRVWAKGVSDLQAENAWLREAITDFAKADKGLRIDYSKYCDKNGYPPDWVYEQDDAYHDMFDKAVANLNEIAKELALKGGGE